MGSIPTEASLDAYFLCYLHMCIVGLVAVWVLMTPVDNHVLVVVLCQHIGCSACSEWPASGPTRRRLLFATLIPASSDYSLVPPLLPFQV